MKCQQKPFRNRGLVHRAEKNRLAAPGSSFLLDAVIIFYSSRDEIAECAESAQASLKSSTSPLLLFGARMPQRDQMRLHVPSSFANTAPTSRSTMAAAAPGKCSGSSVCISNLSRMQC